MTDLRKFLSEIQMLKRVQRSGFPVAGITETDSVAEHALLSAQIAFILAEMEGADAEKAAIINLFHDNHEARVGDHNKVSARYLETGEAEKTAELEQLANLPDEINHKIIDLLNQKRERNTIEGIIAQDADWLEVAIQAKIYLEQGYTGAQNWIDNVENALETQTAKKILAEIKNDSDFTNCWWQGIKKMTYTKLDK